MDRRQSAAFGHGLADHAVEVVVLIGQHRTVTLAQRGPVAIGVIAIELIVIGVDRAGLVWLGEVPVRLAIKPVIEHRGLVAACIRHACHLAVGGEAVGCVIPHQRRSHTLLDPHDPAFAVIMLAGDAVGP